MFCHNLIQFIVNSVGYWIFGPPCMLYMGVTVLRAMRMIEYKLFFYPAWESRAVVWLFSCYRLYKIH